MGTQVGDRLATTSSVFELGPSGSVASSPSHTDEVGCHYRGQEVVPGRMADPKAQCVGRGKGGDGEEARKIDHVGVDVSEVYSPERVTARARDFGMEP